MSVVIRKLACLLVWAVLAVRAVAGAPDAVVVYTSVDQVFSEPVLEEFQRRTGVRVDAVYDAEAVKTVGLATRLAAEKARPRADVFWSGEVLQSIHLAREGLFDAYRPPSADGIPAAFRDPADRWVGFACRARVLLVNRKLVPRDRWPHHVQELVSGPWEPGQVGLANPLFGTTSTHVAALYATLGPARAAALLRAFRARARVTDGNAMVRDLVVSGQLVAGLTDTDDALGAVQRGADVELIVPDQAEGESGALLIPNTVALVHGAPHPEPARVLIDYLASAPVEARLIAAGAAQLAVRPGVPAPVPALANVKALRVSFDAAADALPRSIADVREYLLR